MSTDQSGSGSHLVRGAIWMIAMRWMMRGMGLFSTVVLARLLTPDDFGVVAIALIMVGLLETIAYLGVDLSLIKDQHAGRDDFDTAWSVQLIQGAMISLLLLVCAPLTAAYFNEPRAVAVILWLAVRPIIDGLVNIGLVALRKDLNFALEFRFHVATKLVGVVIQIGAALVFRNYWALVVGMIASSVTTVAMSYLLHPYRPRFTLTQAAKIWSFSQWLLVARVGSFFNRRADEFVVGNLLGTGAMGGYHVAYELASTPTSEIIMPMRRALFPALSRVAQDAVLYPRMVIDTLRSSAVICFGLGVGLACSADLVVPLILGEQWLATVPLLRWLALFGVSAAVSSVLEVPLWVAGRTQLSALNNWIELALVVPLLYLATRQWGMQGAAAGRFAVSLCMVPVAWWMVRSACGLPIWTMARALLPSLLAALVMAAAMLGIDMLVPMPQALRLLTRLCVGTVVYCLSLWLLWRLAGRPAGIEASALAAGRGLLRRLTRR